MKLIDEKIKALGLTKGQYCEKYGFKFKDFAAKVHTLEAKLEWANAFLKPLGLGVSIVSTMHTVSGVDTSAFKAGQVLILDPESPGGLRAADSQELVLASYAKEAEKLPLFPTHGNARIEGTVGKFVDEGLGKGSKRVPKNLVLPLGTLIEWGKPEGGVARAEIAMVDTVEECYGVYGEQVGEQDLIPFKDARLVSDADSLL